ncbi:MAG: DUF805 domain-containing protein [Pseudarcicella sp.]|nr:DUF805 domain-containing protein [Pseudarcicella sp.]
MNYFLKCFRNYANFKGRARRSEYWYFQLFLFLAVFLFKFFIGLLFGGGGVKTNMGSSELFVVVIFGILIPSLAVGARRMHDVGKSGWFLLIPIYSLVLLCTEGDVGENEYGPDPKEEEF